MKRKLFTLAMAATTALAVMAVPAKRITKTVTQPDGSTLTVTLVGDERAHSFVTSDGLAVDITPEGYAVYRAVDGPTLVYAHEAADRPASEQAFLASRSSSVKFEAIQAASPRMETMKRIPVTAPATAQAPGSPRKINIEQGASQVPHKGTAHIPIILVQYTDVKFRSGDNADQDFADFFMGDTKSVRKYFQDMSMGQYDPQFHILGPYTLSNNRAYYGANDYYGNDLRVGEMAKEALQLAGASGDCDMSIFDNDGNGIGDVFVVLYAGVGEASSVPQVTASVWPCQWSLSGARVGQVTLNGVTFNDFAVFNELNGTYQSKIDGVGTVCHEFSHCLGLPDFYETTYYYGYYGMGNWSLMDHGCYNDDGYTPIGYSAYEKAFMGWLDMEDGKTNTQYKLPVLNDPANLQSKAVALVNSKDANEYFVLENRAKVGWDAFIEDEGMLITHVTYKASAWDGNEVNNYSLQRMTPVPADNRLNSDTESSDLWPKSYATEFTDESSPAAKVNTGSYLSMPVTEIVRDADTREVSFWVDRIPTPALDTPEPEEPVVELPGSFTATWSPIVMEGTDVTYTLQVWPKGEGMPAPDVYQDFARTGLTWSESGYIHAFSNYVQLGSNTRDGGLTSPADVNPTDGMITIVANGKRYGTDAGSVIVLSLLDSTGKEVASETFDAGQNQQYFSVMFSGLDNGAKYAVKVANKGTKKRVVVYNVMAVGGNHTGMEDADYAKVYAELAGEVSAPAKVSQTEEAGRITISGITDTSYTVTDLGVAVYRFRVKAVPTDPEKAVESPWSATREVEVLTSGVDDVTVNEPVASYLILNGEIVATPGSRLYSVSGIEMNASGDGRFAVAPGAYILVTPGHRPAKIVL